MVIARYYRSLVESRTLAPPWPMLPQEAKRYRAWQRHTRRLRALDKCVASLRALCVKRYTEELARINADDGPIEQDPALSNAPKWTRRGGGPPVDRERHAAFESERWRRS